MRRVERHYVTAFDDFQPSGSKVGDRRIAFGIDLDGCVDMGMEKHLLAFGVATMIHYSCQPIQSMAMKAWMYVNFYSLDRGTSRFIALYKWGEIVANSKAAKALGLPVPTFKYLRGWCDVAKAFSPGALKEYIDGGDFSAITKGGGNANDARAELESVLEWSDKVNDLVDDATANMNAFPNAVKMLRDAYSRGCDCCIVSGTPEDHIVKMVENYGIDGCLEGLWGQEAGKKQHALVTMMVGPISAKEIDAAIKDKKPLLDTRAANYDALVMVGDAPKDNEEREKANLALSGQKDTPIGMHLIPVEGENDSWETLHANLDKIIAGTWSKEDERAQIDAGLANLSVEWVESPVYAFKRKS
ncbi:MAG: hypothetical protein O3A46_07870 [Candidatus Poribacteria bacterium]|nr:hypothetical protein [Candidatus Poribacteria bacterium]